MLTIKDGTTLRELIEIKLRESTLMMLKAPSSYHKTEFRGQEIAYANVLSLLDNIFLEKEVNEEKG